MRQYDPALERFLQPDPSEREGMRSYVYAGDAPVDRGDPSGLDSCLAGQTSGCTANGADPTPYTSLSAGELLGFAAGGALQGVGPLLELLRPEATPLVAADEEAGAALIAASVAEDRAYA